MLHLTKDIAYPAVATLFAVAGAGFDVKSRRIPNFVTGPAIVAGLLIHTHFDGLHGLLTSLGAGLLCGVIFLVFYLAGGMGAGDVKLITAVGCLAGISNSAVLMIMTSLAGGAMGIALALLRGRLKSILVNVVRLAAHHTHQGLTPHPELHVRNSNTLRLPYGLAIAAGSCSTFFLQGTRW